jgi:hypothetical protein
MRPKRRSGTIRKDKKGRRRMTRRRIQTEWKWRNNANKKERKEM